MAHKVKNNHYVATHTRSADSPNSGGYLHRERGSSRDENDSHSHRAPSERTLSEYTVSTFRE